jgi:uncharacterized protein
MGGLFLGQEIMVFDPLTVYVLAVIFVATLIRSTIGFGEALVAVPLLALRIPVTIAAPMAVIVSVVVAAIVVAQDWWHVQIRSAAGLILPALVGVPLGIWMLMEVDGRIVKMILGAIIISFSVYSLMGRNRLHVGEKQVGWLIGCGFLSGVLGGAYGMNGPPLAVYGSLRQWSPQHFRATLQGYFLPVSLAGLLGYLAMGMWSAAITRYFFLSLPGVVLAILMGRALNRRMKDRRFFSMVYVALIVIGGVLIVQAMMIGGGLR